MSLSSSLPEPTLIAMGLSKPATLCHHPQWPQHLLLRAVWQDWQRLVDAAFKAGFEPVIVSSYRNFERQLAIWSGKVDGSRPVLDDQENPVDITQCEPLQLLQSIMRFSALPGASRHHWGSDFDIADISGVPSGYSLQLTRQEIHAYMQPFYQWLETYLPESGFTRPYLYDTGGIACEPWHLSHRSSAERIQQATSYQHLQQVYQQLARPLSELPDALVAPMQARGLDTFPLIEAVVEHFDALYYRFIE